MLGLSLNLGLPPSVNLRQSARFECRLETNVVRGLGDRRGGDRRQVRFGKCLELIRVGRVVEGLEDVRHEMIGRNGRDLGE